VVTKDDISYNGMVLGVFAILTYRVGPRFADLPDQQYWSAAARPAAGRCRRVTRAAGDASRATTAARPERA
jgi:hypothetical protein